jgi:hypothetical protein
LNYKKDKHGQINNSRTCIPKKNKQPATLVVIDHDYAFMVLHRCCPGRASSPGSQGLPWAGIYGPVVVGAGPNAIINLFWKESND